MPTSQEIRQQFIDFFVSKAHTVVRSAPLIPQDDPTLLFTNAGMNQFKPVFLGVQQPTHPRVVDTQKCIRAGGKHNDLEEVGKDGHHHTFFEMLGNWSFADYYKAEAIEWAWELLTGVWGLPKDKLYASVHHTDDDAFELWRARTDIDPSHVERHGDKDNFWLMADTGPCGPCSEIHIDRGPAYCNKQGEPGHVCRVNGDCDRIMELWNLVFIQFNRDENGVDHPLEHRYVDTGAGFERVVAVLQGEGSNYHTDLFLPILSAIAELSGKPYDRGEAGTSHRVIADHIRCLAFAITDGGMPSNEGRGYVLRRILRRAARHGRLLGLHDPFLFKLVDTVIDVMGDHFTELRERRAHTMQIIQAEEERFNQTLDNGLSRFEEIVANLTGDVIAGPDAFMLYDTFGFPLDLTRVMAEERNLRVDEAGFTAEMEKQRQRARDAGKFKSGATEYDWRELRPEQPTEFVGYTLHETEARVLKWSSGEGERVTLVLDRTPFYAESGGQVADIGRVYCDAWEVRVDTVRKGGELWLHEGELLRGAIDDTPATAVIESERRMDIARNHTATHLLHAALRQVLGEHVQQKGSAVEPDRLRFDFTHFRQVAPRELELVEQIVNARVRDCLPVETEIMSIDEAKSTGAMALFGEKYDDNVRVVSASGFSRELCGGTHVGYTGQIGLFKIVSESASAAGIRRIEAITGERAESLDPRANRHAARHLARVQRSNSGVRRPRARVAQTAQGRPEGNRRAEAGQRWRRDEQAGEQRDGSCGREACGRACNRRQRGRHARRWRRTARPPAERRGAPRRRHRRQGEPAGAGQQRPCEARTRRQAGGCGGGDRWRTRRRPTRHGHGRRQGREPHRRGGGGGSRYSRRDAGELMQAYGPAFARIYNLRWNDFADTVAPYLLAFLDARGIRHGRLLDLCCGAGRLTQKFLEADWKVVGLDLSEHMLEHARANCAQWATTGQASFIRADAADFTLDAPVDTVVSTYDALNHLPDEAALKGCFASVKKALKPGGWFIFDLNTAFGLTGWNSLSVRELDDVVIITRGAYDDNTRRAWTRISGFYEVNDQWKRFGETIYNCAWPMEDVALWLRQAGFSRSHFARVRTLDQPVDDPESERRVFVAARS